MPNDPYQILDPQLAADQIALERRMALAQALRQQSMQGIGDTKMLGGVAIQKSPLEGINQLFQGYTAGKMDEQNDASRMEMAKKRAVALDPLFGNTSNVSPVGSAATDIPAYLNGTANLNTLPDLAGFKQAQAQMPQQQNQGFSLTSDPRRDRMIASLIGPDKYMELYAKNYEPTNEMRNFNAPGQFGRLMQTKLANDATMEMKQGSTYIDPITHQPQYMPKIGEGMDYNPLTRTSSDVRGYAGGQARIEGTKAGAVAGAQEREKAHYADPIVLHGAGKDGSDLIIPRVNAPGLNGPITTQSPGEHAASVAAGTASGASLAKAKNDLPQTIANADLTIKQIDEMVGNKDLGIPQHPGFQGYVGATWTPGMRYIEGSPESDFQSRQEQIKGGVFLKAYQDLKGGGQITEIEGAKAEQALNRMNKSQSKEEYITAARDYQKALRTGVKMAREQAGQSGNSNVIDFGSLK